MRRLPGSIAINGILMTDKAELKSCGFLLIQGDPVQSFLLMKHHDRWDLPKGHTEPGESELDCAYRETEEETGIHRKAISLVPDFCYRHQYFVQYKRTGGSKMLKELVIFLGRVSDDCQIQLTEHIGYDWFDWNPPHHIQTLTIDPLLQAVARHFADRL